MSEQTNATTADAATLADVVNLSDLTLLGTFGSEGREAALVRLPSSRLLRIVPSDRLGRFRVRAIEPGRLILESQGQAHTLDWPDIGNNAA